MNIDVDDRLLDEAMAVTGLSTERETIIEALRRLVAEYRRRRAIEDLAGLGWTGELDEMRSTRVER